MAAIENLKEGDFKKSVGKGIAVIGFWAPWCHTCHQVMPLLERTASEFKKEVKFFKVNVMENPALSSRYGVMSLPNILIFNQEKVSDQIVGLTTQEKIEERLSKLF